MVKSSFRICTRNKFSCQRNRRIAKVDRNPKDLIQKSFVFANSFNPTMLIGNTYDNDTTIRICKRTHCIGKVCWLYHDTFTVKCLTLFL